LAEERPPENIKWRNPVQACGWAGLYHAATLDPRITDGALRLYCLLLMHAQQKGVCWPGVAKLAFLLDKDPKTVKRRVANLVEHGYITRERRLGDSSITWIEDLTADPYLRTVALAELERRAKGSARGDRNAPLAHRGENAPNAGAESPHASGHKVGQKEQQKAKEQQSEEEDASLFWGEGGPPEREPEQPGQAGRAWQARIEETRAKGTGLVEGGLLLDAATRAARDAAGITWTDDAGNPEPWGVAVDAFLVLVGRTPGPDNLRKEEKDNWPRALQEWAESHGRPATPAEAVEAIEAIGQSDQKWRTFARPYGDTFKAVASTMLDRIRAGAPLDRNGQNGTGKAQPKAKAEGIDAAFGGR